MNKGSHKHYKNAKAVIGFLIVALGFALFLLFYNYQDSITQSGNLYSFMTLVVIIMGFMIGLFYLVSNQKHPQKAAVSKPSKKTKKKSR